MPTCGVAMFTKTTSRLFTSRKKTKVQLARELKGSLQLGPLEYQKFWQEIVAPTHNGDICARTFLIQLLKKIVALESEKTKDKEEKKIRKGDAFLAPFVHHHCLRCDQDIVDVFKGSILSTIRFVLHFSNIRLTSGEIADDVSNYLNEKWKPFENYPGVCRKISEELKHTMSAQELQLTSPNPVFVPDQSAAKVLAKKESSLLVIVASMFGPSPPVDKNRSVLTNYSDFEWLFFRKKLFTQKNEVLFSEVCKVISTLPTRLRSVGLSLEHTLNSFSSCLVFLRQLLVDGAPNDPVVLEETLLPVLKSFCDWPYPYGAMAEELEWLVSSELRAPGACARAQLFDEYPHLSEKGIATGCLNMLGRGNKKNDIWPEMQRSVLLYTSDGDVRGNILADSLRHVVDLETESSKALSLQKEILYSIFEQTLDILDPNDSPHSDGLAGDSLRDSGGWRKVGQEKSNLVDIDLLGLDSCEPDLVRDCYIRAICIMREAEENCSWPIKVVKEWTASMLATVVQAIDDRFIVFPAFHLKSGRIGERGARLFQHSAKKIIKLASAAKAFMSHDEETGGPKPETKTSPPRCGVDASAAAPQRRSGKSSTSLHLPPLQFEFAERCNLKPLKRPMWRGGFSQRFKYEFMASGASLDFSSAGSMSSMSGGSTPDLLDHEDPMHCRASLYERVFRYPESRSYEVPVNYNGKAVLNDDGSAKVTKHYGHFVASCFFALNTISSEKSSADEDAGLYPSTELNRRASNLPHGRQGSRSDRRRRDSSMVLEHIQQSWRDQTFSEIAMGGFMAQDVPHTASGDGAPASTLRICAMGNDATVHRILCNYVSVMQEWGHRLKTLKFCFYIVPTSKREANLATSLARTDAWYRRHIFNPFTAPSFSFPYCVVSPGTAISTHATLAWVKTALRTLTQGKKTTAAIEPGVFQSLADKLAKKMDDEGMRTSVLRLCIEMDQLPNDDPAYGQAVYGDKRLSDFVMEVMRRNMEEYRRNIENRYSPDSILKDLLQDYVRLAKYTLPVCIFECECWEKQHNESLSFKIPFCATAEIGIRARAVHFQRLSALDQSMTLDALGKAKYPDVFPKPPAIEDTLASSDFQKYVGPSEGAVRGLSIAYQEIDAVGGIAALETVEHSGSYFRVGISNISNYSDAQNKRDLGSSTLKGELEVHSVARNQTKVSSQVAMAARQTDREMDRLEERELDAINGALMEGGTRAVVKRISVSVDKVLKRDVDENFMILLDGELFGPFEKVAIKPMMTEEGKHMFFPVSTFFPVEAV